jgi:hypothetical protein
VAGRRSEAFARSPVDPVPFEDEQDGDEKSDR